MGFQIVAICVGLEQLVGEFADLVADRNHGESDDIQFAGILGAEEISEAQPALTSLTGKGEAGALRSTRVEDDQVVALANTLEIAVDDSCFQDPFGLEPVEPVAQARTSLRLDQLLVRAAFPAAPCAAQAPLAHKRRALVEQSGVIRERDAFDDSISP